MRVISPIHFHPLLVAYRDHEPDRADREIKRLIRDYPRQRMAALCAKTVVLCRQAEGLPKILAAAFSNHGH